MVYFLFSILRGWGKRPAIRPQTQLCGVALDIEIYLNVTEPMHPSQGRDGIQIRFRILLRYCEGSEHLKIT